MNTAMTTFNLQYSLKLDLGRPLHDHLTFLSDVLLLYTYMGFNFGLEPILISIRFKCKLCLKRSAMDIYVLTLDKLESHM